jgi:hypothetical protein
MQKVGAHRRLCADGCEIAGHPGPGTAAGRMAASRLLVLKVIQALAAISCA